jgi:hypothetical protein
MERSPEVDAKDGLEGPLAGIRRNGGDLKKGARCLCLQQG